MTQGLADYVLRPMQASDLESVLSIEATVHSHPWTQGNFNDSLKAGHQAWVMSVNGEMIGYSLMMLVLDEAHLLNVSIAQAYQKQGLGHALLTAMVNQAKNSGARHMFLEVRASNVSAIALYEKIGFVEVNVRRGYYRSKNGREDAVLMSLAI